MYLNNIIYVELVRLHSIIVSSQRFYSYNLLIIQSDLNIIVIQFRFIYIYIVLTTFDSVLVE